LENLDSLNLWRDLGDSLWRWTLCKSVGFFVLFCFFNLQNGKLSFAEHCKARRS